MYAVAASYVPGCPTCDGTCFYGKIFFYNTLEELYQDALNMLDEYEFHNIFDSETKEEVGEFVYDYGFHCYVGFKVVEDTVKPDTKVLCRTIDDGTGKKRIDEVM